MIVERDAAALRAWIEDAANGRAPLPPGDASPWDQFYAEYRATSPAVRSRVDAVFQDLAASPDAEVRGAVVSHWYEADPRVGFAALAALLAKHPSLYADQATQGTSFTLRAWLLGGLATQASGADARDLLLGAVAGCGPLPRTVGTYIGGLGLDATDALVRARPDASMAPVVQNAGYELHRDPAAWPAVLARAATWPAPLRAALLAGGAEHKARFGGP